MERRIEDLEDASVEQINMLDEWLDLEEWVSILRTLNPNQVLRLCEVASLEHAPISKVNHHFWCAVTRYHYAMAFMSIYSPMEGWDFFIEKADVSKYFVKRLKIYNQNPDIFNNAWDADLEYNKNHNLFRSEMYESGMITEWGQDISGAEDDPEKQENFEKLKAKKIKLIITGKDDDC